MNGLPISKNHKRKMPLSADTEIATLCEANVFPIFSPNTSKRLSMLISGRKQFVFFHLPKAAGSSLESALRKYSHIPSTRLYNYLFDYLGERAKIGLFNRHISPRELKLARPDLFSSAYVKFAVVRNTWDWHCSQYSFHKKQPKTVFHTEIKGMNFAEYVHWACDPNNMDRANSRQKKYLSDWDGTFLIDRILKFENLDREFSQLCEELSLNTKLPKKNSSARKVHYRDEYTDELKQKIADAHKEDIDYFGFEF